MAAKSFEFKPGSLKRNLRNFNGDINHLVAGVIDYSSDKAKGYMKTNAPWKDRSGNARQTLNSHAEHTSEYHEIHMYGGMPYQIWLEVRWAGRWGIIGKAVKFQGLATMNRLKGLITKLGRS